MVENKSEFITIETQNDWEYLVERIMNGPKFAESFRFREEAYFAKLLEFLKVDYEEYKEKNYYFDKSLKLHISSSESDYTWISTMGLVAKGKSTTNCFINSCINQYTVISLLFDKAIELSNSDDVYDVDGYEFGYLSDFTPALFHNILFYFEIFAKAYLSFYNVKIPHTHELSKLNILMKKTMFEKNQNDSLFHVYIVTEFDRVVQYIDAIPGRFKEQFVKYDDNSNDYTVILFDPENLKEIKKTIDMSNDLITGFYYNHENMRYLKSGLFEKLLKKAETDDEKQRITEMYGHLIQNSY